MVQDIQMKLNPGLPWQKQHSKRRGLFSTPIGLNLREKFVKSYIRSTAIRKLHTSETRSEVTGEF